MRNIGDYYSIPHLPIMINEVILALNIKPDGIYVDGTLGKGGHSKSIIKELSGKGLLIGIDRDEQSISFCNQYFKEEKTPHLFYHESYNNFNKILNKLKIKKVDGIFLDLGLSSVQLESADRGFSYKVNSDLDMRFDLKQKRKAFDILNNFDFKNLSDIIFKYSNERRSKLIAKRIIDLRPMKSVNDLVEAIRRSTPPKNRVKTLARVFQAIRIEVNNEINLLKEFLSSFTSKLNDSGRIAIISFHSIEDRLVKHNFKQMSLDGSLDIHTKKPIIPTRHEMSKNLRCKSAKLRIAEKRPYA